jgi:hypothetical protein
MNLMATAVVQATDTPRRRKFQVSLSPAAAGRDHRFPHLVDWCAYSLLSDTIGSTFDARLAGR